MQTRRFIPLATKLNLAICLSLASVFFMGSSLVIWHITDTQQAHSQVRAQNTLELATGMAQAYLLTESASADALGKAFARKLQGTFSRQDTQNTEPTLLLNHVPLNGHTGYVDDFVQETGAVATIFALRESSQGKDWVRIATSVRDEKGMRALGTLLARTHPAYEKLNHTQSYTGPATLFARDYMTWYRPIQDASGQLIGALFIGKPAKAQLEPLQQALKTFRTGEDGYLFIAANDPKNLGYLIAHPFHTGKKLQDLAGGEAQATLTHVLQQPRGIAFYDWKNPGEHTVSQRFTRCQQLNTAPWSMCLSASFTEEQQDARMLGWELAGMAVSVLLCAIVLIYLLIRRLITRPLRQLVAVSQALANGRLDIDIPTGAADETGQLMQANQHMLTQMRQSIGPIQAMATQLQQASVRLTAQSDSVANGAHQQSLAAASMTAAVEELSSSIEHLAEHAQDAQQLTQQADQATQTGRQVIETTQTSMSNTADTVNRAAEVVDSLGQQAHQIVSIVEVIQSIAEQTNLLALNAAIEAARAGESGRGFAVVADEVRKLAERTSQSTEAVARMIEQIQQGSQQAMAGMADGVRHVAEGSSVADIALQHMTDIRMAAHSVTDAVASMVSTLHEQAHSSAALANHITQIGEHASQNEQSAQASAALANTLRKLSDGMLDAVAFFHLEK